MAAGGGPAPTSPHLVVAFGSRRAFPFFPLLDGRQMLVSVISKIPVLRLHYVPPTPCPTPLFTAGHVAYGLLCASLRLLSLTHFQASKRGCQLPVSPEAAAVRVPGKGSAATSTPPLCSAHPKGTVCRSAPPLGTAAWDSALLAPLLLHWGGYLAVSWPHTSLSALLPVCPFTESEPSGMSALSRALSVTGSLCNLAQKALLPVATRPGLGTLHKSTSGLDTHLL